MDSNDWELLTVLREKLSITKTAEKLFISQPSLTYRLSKLEAALGISIVDRHSNGVSFTPEGEILVEYCRKMQEEYGSLLAELYRCKEKQTGSLSLGITTTYSKFYLPEILSAFKKEYPGIRIEMTTAHYYELMDLFRNGKVDLLVIRGESDWNEKKYLICEETYGFVGGKNFRTEDIPETPWIRHEISGTRIQSRKFLNEWWKDRFGEAFHSETISVNSIEAVVNLVARGFGWAVLPEVHTKNREDLRFFPITKKDGSGFRRNTWLLCKNKSVKKEVVRMFMECILRKG